MHANPKGLMQPQRPGTHARMTCTMMSCLQIAIRHKRQHARPVRRGSPRLLQSTAQAVQYTWPKAKCAQERASSATAPCACVSAGRQDGGGVVEVHVIMPLSSMNGGRGRDGIHKNTKSGAAEAAMRLGPRFKRACTTGTNVHARESTPRGCLAAHKKNMPRETLAKAQGPA